MARTVEAKSKSSPVVCVVGLAASVALAALHLVSGPAAIAAIITICLKTDAESILKAIKGKE